MMLRFLVLLSLIVGAPLANATRCNGRIVDNGAYDFQVRQRCGDPFWVEQSSVVDVRGARSPIQVQTEQVYEPWFYNFGPQRLMLRLVFLDGRLINEQTLGYGVREIGNDCRPNGLIAGLSTGEIVARCGEPQSRRSNDALIVRRDGFGGRREREVPREEWVYDFGNTQFLRVLTVIDGRLQNVDTIPR
jgi:hypothetical protein